MVAKANFSFNGAVLKKQVANRIRISRRSGVSASDSSPNQTVNQQTKQRLKMKKGILLISAFAFLIGMQQSRAQSNASGWSNGYYWSLWSNSGTVTMGFGGGGNFSVSWKNIGDGGGGEGWNPGGSRTVGYNVGALSGNWNNVGIYGWTTSPLIEYYITDMGGQSGTYIGSLSSDGGSYNVYKHQQVNQPSIQGTATFWQYLSGRTSNQSTGANHTITTGNHFNYWKSHIGSMGSFNYMKLNLEAWGNASGYFNATVW